MTWVTFIRIDCYDMEDILLKLIEIKELLISSCQDIVISSNKISLDAFEQVFLVSFRIDKEIEMKVEHGRLKFPSRVDFKSFVSKELIDVIRNIENTSKTTLSNGMSKNLSNTITTPMPKKRKMPDLLEKIPAKRSKIVDEIDGDGDDAENGNGIQCYVKMFLSYKD